MTTADSFPTPSEPAGIPPAATAAPVTARGAGLVMATVVLIWGFGPPLTKLISAPPLVVVSVRLWITVPLIWAVTHLSGRRLSADVLRRTALAGALLGTNLVLVVATLQRASVAVLAVLQALQPGVVLVVAGRALGERVTAWHVAWTGVGVGGVVVVVLGGNPEVRGEPLGVLFGVASLLTFTAYYLSNRMARSVTDMDALEWMTGVTLVGTLTVTPFALALSSAGDYGRVGGADWVYLGFMAVVVGIVSHTMMSWTHRYIPASRSSLYLLGMNVVSMAAAWPINGEPVRPLQALGGAVVVGAVAAVITRPPAPLPAATPSRQRARARY